MGSCYVVRCRRPAPWPPGPRSEATRTSRGGEAEAHLPPKAQPRRTYRRRRSRGAHTAEGAAEAHIPRSAATRDKQKRPGPDCTSGPRRQGDTGNDLLSHHEGSTIGAAGLNFSVRNGKRWNPRAIVTGIKRLTVVTNGAVSRCYRVCRVTLAGSCLGTTFTDALLRLERARKLDSCRKEGLRLMGN